jgi:hypothetical protein
MTSKQTTAPLAAEVNEDLRARYARFLELFREWRADESGYDETVFPILKVEMEADRLSYRKRFKT